MQRLPLYEGHMPTRSVIEAEAPLCRSSLPKDKDGRLVCNRCKLSEKPMRNPVLPAVGAPGGLLVVGERPVREDDVAKMPFMGKYNRRTRGYVDQHWKGPVVYDTAVRCIGDIPDEKHIEGCRGYLAKTVADADPTRIIAVGAAAAYALLGRSVSAHINRRGVGFITNAEGHPVPVFLVMNPDLGFRNRFAARWFAEDMEWACTADPPSPPWDVDLRVIETVSDALAAREELFEHANWASVDVETTGKMWSPYFKIIAVSVCGDHDDSPFTWGKAALNDPHIFAVLKDILTSPRLDKGGQNVKYDSLAFRAQHKFSITPLVFDTRLERKLLNPDASGALPQMAELVGMGGLKEEAAMVMGSYVKRVKDVLAREKRSPPKKPPKKPPLRLEDFLPAAIESAIRLGSPVEEYKFDLLTNEELWRYNARDAVATTAVKKHVAAELAKEPELTYVWDEVVKPASRALERVEAWGVPCERRSVEVFDQYLAVEESKAQRILDQYGAGVNWKSVPQIRDLLFSKLRLPVQEMTPTGPSTDAATLKKLASKHPLPDALLTHRHITKMRGTYANGMIVHIADDDRIRPNIKLDGTATGRASCTAPNLQNIPRAKGSVEGKMARDCFVARPGYSLLELDFSQLELRVAAYLSGDQKMIAGFNSGEDFHMRTAKLIAKIAWGIDISTLTEEHRSRAKSVIFGILYGKTAHTFSKEWGTTKEAAQTVVDAIMGEFSTLAAWCTKMQREASKDGFVWTYWKGKKARRRPLWHIGETGDDDGSRARKSVATNGAVNTPVQGSAAEFCTASLAEGVTWIEDDGLEDVVKLVLPVHDALLNEVRDDYIAETAGTLKEIMTGWGLGDVPLLVDAKVGKSWGSMTNYAI